MLRLTPLLVCALLMACGNPPGANDGGDEPDAGGGATFTLSVTRQGDGTVTSSPAGINCGADCTEVFPEGSVVTLTATPGAGATFTGWSGGCSGVGTCTLTLTANASVTATFGVQQVPLTVQRAGTGSGTVQSAPVGIDCGSNCSSTYDLGASVTLTANADPGSRFTGWSGGGCSGTGSCTTTLSTATTVTATFERTFAVTVTLAGTGGGAVISVPAGIDCGLDCTETWDSGTMVTLTATPAPGSSFAGWSGACSGTGACVLSLTAATQVTATFTRDTFAFTAALSGTGTGAVSSSPAGIDCGLDCSEIWEWGTVVTLTATPAAGSVFTGWTGACSGTGACAVTVTAITTVGATFTLTTHDLTVTPAGTGSGTVSSVPPGIDCGADCTEAYDFGTMVTLSATPSAGSTFDGWTGGGCSGTGPCTTTITAATTVTATFSLTTHDLVVTRTGNGGGTVSSVPAGISCGMTCSATYAYGSTVVLTATPSADSDFNGWTGGGCTGTGTTCVVPVASATTVAADFVLKRYTVDVTRLGAGSGTVTSTPAGISCGSTCSGLFEHGTVLTFDAVANAGSTFSGWSGGGCSGTGTCVVTLTGPLALDATFTQLPVTLTVVPAGGGTGVVSSAPSGINCGADCSEPYSIGSMVVLTATAAAGSSFSGWSGGGCTGTGTCTVTLNAATSVTATFVLTGGCDSFNVANSTTITGWTERLGDWVVDNGRLRDTTPGSAYSHVITMNGSTQLDGCAHLTAIHTGALNTNAVGVVLRWTSASSYVVAVVQDNSSSGNFNTAYIYQYPLADIGGQVTGSFGRNADIEVCANGTTVTLRIDANRDGTYETTRTGVTNITTPGLAGIAMYATPPNPLADNFCWYP